MLTQHSARSPVKTVLQDGCAETLEPVQAAEIILRRFGARAISILTSPRQMEDGRTIPARLSANDCYVAMAEACRKSDLVPPLTLFKALRTQMDELGFAPDHRIAALSELPKLVAAA